MCLRPFKVLLPESDLWQDVPCQNNCPECLSKRAVDWAYRVGHQLSETEDNSFVTLTYDSEKKGYAYDYSDFQKFLKILRSRYPGREIKYMVSIEHGGENGRLHFHAILFNWYPKQDTTHTIKELKTSKSGYLIYRSTELESMWKHGFSSVAPASVGTAYYIASYALSENSFVTDDGEILSDKMKVSQGIGLTYFVKNFRQILDLAQHENRSIPRYYTKKLAELFPEEYLEFRKYLFDMKSKIIPKEDNHARLLEHNSKTAQTEFRKPRKYENLEASLSNYAFKKALRKK